MSDANPGLGPDLAGTKGGEHTLEQPGEARNLVWQSRAAPPTAAENRLADALQRIFGDAVYDLPGIVARLNQAGLVGPGGDAWTEASFTAELARLGA
jgi:hypothetical protein